MFDFFGKWKLTHLRLRRFFRRAIPIAVATLISFVIGFSPVAHGLDVEVKDWRNIRSMEEGREVVAILAPGSVVDIPDQYALRGQDGKVNPELTLNNWLRRAAATPSSEPVSLGEGKQEHLYPIRVRSAATGSTNTQFLHAGHQYYVALDYLAHNNGLLVVSDPAPLYTVKPPVAGPAARAGTPPARVDNKWSLPKTPLIPQAPAPKKLSPKPAAPKITPRPSVHLETDSPCARGNCPHEEQPLDAAISLLKQALNPIEKFTERALAAVSMRTSDDLDSIRARFKESCGIHLRSFIPEVVRQAREIGFPPSTLLAIMTQESSGNCMTDHYENGGYSVGLFQVRSNRFPMCTETEKDQIRSATTLEELRYSPRCLQNPVVNLAEAIHVLKEKEAVLTAEKFHFTPIEYTSSRGEAVFTGATVKGFDRSLVRATGARPNPNTCSLVISAYNGGELWVFRAKRDLEIFNEKNHEHYQPENWEDLRLFYLRRHLNRYNGVQEQLFGRREVGRDEAKSISNLSYVDNVCPSTRSTPGHPSLSEKWRAVLARAN